MPMDDAHYMRIALTEARIARDEDEVPVGAVVVCNDKIIAKTHNQTQRLHDVTAHAEMLAVTAAATWLGGKYLTGCTIYVTVEPCTMCAGALGWAQVGKVVYGTDDPKRGYTRIAPDALHPKTEVVSGVLRDECSALVKEYFKMKRGKK